MPTRTNAHVTCHMDMPDARITVYSELATSCDNAKSVPIRAAVGTASKGHGMHGSLGWRLRATPEAGA